MAALSVSGPASARLVTGIVAGTTLPSSDSSLIGRDRPRRRARARRDAGRPGRATSVENDTLGSGLESDMASSSHGGLCDGGRIGPCETEAPVGGAAEV